MFQEQQFAWLQVTDTCDTHRVMPEQLLHCVRRLYSRHRRVLVSGASCLSSGRARELQSSDCLNASILYSLHVMRVSQGAANQVAAQSDIEEKQTAIGHISIMVHLSLPVFLLL